jgi:UDP-N-acetylmuramoyl-tripeptide--D-alanyl-D-alanine ligase
MLTVRDIVEATGGKLVKGKPHARIRTFSIDSRTLRRGDFFVAVRGPRFDGHDFIGEAVRKGACGILIDRRPYTANRAPIIIRVNDTIAALGDTAHYIRMQSKAAIIAVTGSNGKTTTKDMIAAMIQRHSGKVLRSRGNENNVIGLPLTLLRLRGEDACVLEMGMNRFGEIDYLTRIAHPQIAAITNIGPCHLEHLGDVRDVAKAKLEVLAHMNASTSLVINGDDPYLTEITHATSTILRFGFKEHNDFRATAVQWREGGWDFVVNNYYPMRLNLLGRHNVYNALAAIAVARLAGADYTNIAQALRTCTVPHSRLESRRIAGVNVIDDTYNSNPASLKQAVEALQYVPTSGRKILVSGDMLELGKKSDFFHENIADIAAAAEVDILITVGKHSRTTHRAARKQGMKKGTLWHFDQPDEAGRLLKQIMKKGDAVLVKGSRGIAMEKALEQLRS